MTITLKDLEELHNAHDLHVHQNLNEFCSWLNMLHGAEYVFELGAYMLGTAELTLLALPSIQKLVTVDCVVHHPDHDNRIAKYNGRLEFLKMSTADPGLRSYKDYDACFVDADHSLLSKLSDFELARSIVKVGGMIGLHDVDVAVGEPQDTLGPRLLFHALRQCYPDRCTKIVGPPGPWGNYGIGVYTNE